MGEVEQEGVNMSIEENMEWIGLKKAQKQLKKVMESIDEARDWLSEFSDDDPLYSYSESLQELWKGLSIDMMFMNELVDNIKKEWARRE